MISIRVDDSVPVGSPCALNVRIYCDGRSLLCDSPIVVSCQGFDPNQWPTEIASSMARARGWRQVNCGVLGRAWKCPVCLKSGM